MGVGGGERESERKKKKKKYSVKHREEDEMRAKLCRVEHKPAWQVVSHQACLSRLPPFDGCVLTLSGEVAEKSVACQSGLPDYREVGGGGGETGQAQVDVGPVKRYDPPLIDLFGAKEQDILLGSVLRSFFYYDCR